MLKKIHYPIKTVDGLYQAHFCYLPEEYKSQLKKQAESFGSLYGLLEYWARIDFGIKLDKSEKAFKELKLAVADKYQAMYPDVFIQLKKIDAQGWMRVWLVEKIRSSGNEEFTADTSD